MSYDENQIQKAYDRGREDGRACLDEMIEWMA